MPTSILVYTLQLVAILFACLLALGYLRAEPGRASNRVFALGAGFVVLYIIEGMTGAHVDPLFRLDLSFWWRFTHPAVQSIPGLFMIYSFLEFQERPRFPRPLLVLFAVQILFEIILAWTGEGFGGIAIGRIAFGLNILQLVFVAMALYWTVKGWSADLVEDRRILRWIGISLQGVIVFCVLLVENFLVVYQVISAAQAQLLIVSAVALLMSFLLLMVMQFDYLSLGRAIQRVTAGPAGDGEDTVEELSLSSFNQQFRDGGLYREAGLTIAGLAGKLHVPEYRLREFIHGTLGFRNFNAMLHYYRIEEAGRLLTDPDNCNVPVLTIALKVGYQSITPFNSAFRDLKGMPPSEFRRQQLRL